jgi:ribosome-associated protein
LSKIGKPRSSKGLAAFTARIANDKLARDIFILELTEIDHAPADFFVLATCDSDVQINAIVGEIEKVTKSFRMQMPKIEGLDTCRWVLLDYFDVVVHLMLKESRDYYKLEKLWGDSHFMVLGSDDKPKTLTITEKRKLLKSDIEV